MKRTIFTLLTLHLFCSIFAQDTRPNILLIAIDDLNDWVGTCTITASQKGNETYNTAPAVTQTLTVQLKISAEELSKQIHVYPNLTVADVHIEVPDVHSYAVFNNHGHELLNNRNFYTIQ